MYVQYGQDTEVEVTEATGEERKLGSTDTLGSAGRSFRFAWPQGFPLDHIYRTIQQRIT